MSTHSFGKKTWNLRRRIKGTIRVPIGCEKKAGVSVVALCGMQPPSLWGGLWRGTAGGDPLEAVGCSLQIRFSPRCRGGTRFYHFFFFWHVNTYKFILTLPKVETHILKHLILIKGSNHVRTRKLVRKENKTDVKLQWVYATTQPGKTSVSRALLSKMSQLLGHWSKLGLSQ